jgi:phytanoyl-CoA hydroxylase
VLSVEQIDRFGRDGFLVVPDFVTAEACDELRRRAEELVEAWEPGAARTVFTTEAQARVSNREFLASGSTSWCFFEEGAFDEHGELRRPKALSINKIGHAMHDLDPVFERFTYTPELAAIAADVGLHDPLVLQSMYIFKQPAIGGEVGCHQDATFLYTDPITVTGFWFAIEDATLENGCLWAAPGAHRTGLRERFRRAGAMTDDDGTEFEVLDPTPLPVPPEDLVPLEVPAGTMVVLDGQLPHWSDANRSGHSRHAYTVHCISASAEYPAWNWLQRRAELPLRRLDTVAA